MRRSVLAFPVAAALACVVAAQNASEYDFLIKGGRVVDPQNKLDGVRDVAIKDGRIASIAANIAPTRALKAVDATGLIVTPGLIDIHVHAFFGGENDSYAGGGWSIDPDSFAPASCVTTITDAGSSGWRNFESFKDRIIDRSKTRVTAFLNIVGGGMGAGSIEQNTQDMEVKPTADMAAKYKGVIVGIKSAHYNGKDWIPYERASEVGRALKVPVMVDFGGNVEAGRTLEELFTKHFRAGDIYSHMYGGRRGEQDQKTNGPSEGMIEGRRRGVLFDVAHGGASFMYRTAVPLLKAGFLPDSISTDLHTSSMNSAMKDMLNVMGKFMAMGMPLEQVLLRSTSVPAKMIQLPELGHLSVGAPADVAVLRLQKGRFGFTDPVGGLIRAAQRLSCEMTVREGKVIYDLNGMIAQPWETLPSDARGGDPKWDFTRGHGRRPGR
ncbi:MAG: amidohydrolase/deacetylase family metallohydrolase [Acidobacteria bacterium]|nr:amidohydrolase/deacetylase family metallohydrolase [Acidobacteriota bacterium]